MLIGINWHQPIDDQSIITLGGRECHWLVLNWCLRIFRYCRSIHWTVGSKRYITHKIFQTLPNLPAVSLKYNSGVCFSYTQIHSTFQWILNLRETCGRINKFTHCYSLVFTQIKAMISKCVTLLVLNEIDNWSVWLNR